MKSVVAILAAAQLGLTGSVVVHRTPPETTEVGLRYHSAVHELMLRCQRASFGQCRVAVRASGITRTLAMATGQLRRVRNLPTTARYCAGGRYLDLSACAWTAVTDAS